VGNRKGTLPRGFGEFRAEPGRDKPPIKTSPSRERSASREQGKGQGMGSSYPLNTVYSSFPLCKRRGQGGGQSAKNSSGSLRGAANLASNPAIRVKNSLSLIAFAAAGQILMHRKHRKHLV
jgi:hypothetical protein